MKKPTRFNKRKCKIPNKKPFITKCNFSNDKNTNLLGNDALDAILIKHQILCDIPLGF